MKIATLTLVSAGLGLLIVRSFLLDPMEEIVWRMFWNDELGWEMVKGTSVYGKCIFGMIVGAVIGFVTGIILPSNLRPEGRSDESSNDANDIPRVHLYGFYGLLSYLGCF